MSPDSKYEYDAVNKYITSDTNDKKINFLNKKKSYLKQVGSHDDTKQHDMTQTNK